LLRDGAVPEHEVAVRIVRTAEEDLTAPRLALDDLAAFVCIPGACDARRLVLDVLAFGVLGARGELAEPPLLDHQIRAAAGAFLVEDLIRLRRFQATLPRCDELPRGPALRISRAREELPEPPPLDDHRPAAVLARFDFLFARLGLRLARLELARVRAVGVAAARDERTELARLSTARRAAAN